MESVELKLQNENKEFLNDSYKFELDGVKVVQILDYPKDETKYYGVVLENTIFHPQGGGQPSDEGVIENKEKNVLINIEGATVDREKDLVLHKISKEKFDQSGLQIGDCVSVKINEEKRRLYARLHSAGHLLDIAVSKIGMNLVPGKGYHFPDGPYVEYNGNIDKTQIESLIKLLESTSNELIEASEEEDATISKLYEYQEAAGKFKIPSYLPENKPFRWVKLLKNDPGCPCGGTHVKHIKDIQSIKITKITNKGKVLRISYNISK